MLSFKVICGIIGASFVPKVCLYNSKVAPLYCNSHRSSWTMAFVLYRRDIPLSMSRNNTTCECPRTLQFIQGLYSSTHTVFTILTKSPSWSSLLPIVLRTRRGAMRSGPTSQRPLNIHGGGQINTVNSILSSRKLTTSALFLSTSFEQDVNILC